MIYQTKLTDLLDTNKLKNSELISNEQVRTEVFYRYLLFETPSTQTFLYQQILKDVHFIFPKLIGSQD